MSKKVAFFLSGSGYLDGSEITEATALIIALSKYRVAVDFFAPNRDQSDVVDHISQTPLNESRNILEESSRIARGKILPIDVFHADRYDAVIMPGGFGAVKNFTNFLSKGIDASLESDIKKALTDAIKHKLWIVAICAAPLPLALAMKETGQTNASVTFGHEDGASDFIPALQSWGIKHINKEINEYHVDAEHKLITSGAYMFHDASPYDIYRCSDFIIEKLLQELVNQ